MCTWSQVEADSREFAEAGRRLLIGSDGTAIGFLATSRGGKGHIAPVCPVFSREDIYLSASATSPKVRDLRANPSYALHAFLGSNDEEFQIAGLAVEVSDPAERTAVHEAIPFAAFDRKDPIFRLGIERVLWVFWERVGQPDTRAVRRRWPSHGTT